MSDEALQPSEAFMAHIPAEIIMTRQRVRSDILEPFMLDERRGDVDRRFAIYVTV